MDKQLPVSVWPEWKIVEKIGEGSFGKVYKAKRTEQGNDLLFCDQSYYDSLECRRIEQCSLGKPG